MNIRVDKSLCSPIIESKFLDVESVVQRRWTFWRLLIHIAKLSPGTLYASFKVSVSQYHWKWSFKRIFHSMPFFFFLFLFWMTQGFCSLPGQFILERIKETRREMISAGDQRFTWEGWRQITGKGWAWRPFLYSRLQIFLSRQLKIEYCWILKGHTQF